MNGMGPDGAGTGAGGKAQHGAGAPGWRTRRMTRIYDLGDPAKRVFIRNFGLPGQQPGATGPAAAELHGPICTGPEPDPAFCPRETPVRVDMPDSAPE
jgi:hypothetical protein